MKSLQTRFFLNFVALGLGIALGVGILMFAEYRRYIQDSYTGILESVGNMVEAQYPVLADPGLIKTQALTNPDAYWPIPQGLQVVADAFGLAYIYLLALEEGEVWFIFDTDDTDDMTDAAESIMLYPADEVPGELKEAFATGERRFSAPYTDEWGSFVSLFIPITSGGQVMSVLCLDYDVSFIAELERRAYIALGTALAVAALISSLAALTVSRSLLRPIKAMVQAGNALAAMDFQTPIPINRQDEIGDMQRALHSIREQQQKTIAGMNNEHLGQKNISGNLGGSIRESSGDLGVITRSMDLMQNRADEQMRSVQQTADSVEGIVGHIHSLDEAVETQGQNIDQSSEAIEGMVTETREVREVVEKARDTTGKLSRASEAGQTMLKQLSDELAHIAEQSAFLEEANAALVNIAAQTNILAMNAAIEAAHAGEAGRGFAVVAGEVRNLAESSNKESNSISSEIKNMRDGIGRIRQVSDDTVKTMGEMFREVTDMERSFHNVSAAVEAQASRGAQILGALANLRETTNQVKRGSGDIERESGAIHGIVENLKGISREVSESVLEVQRACEGIAESLAVAQRISEGRYLVAPEG
jgi:methyl-accepting chemotaxis protein